MKIAGAHAVVTGGGTGIGSAIAWVLACEGAKVTLLGRRLEPLKAVADAIGAQASFACCDVTDPESVATAMCSARGSHGPVDILINNAGAVTSAPFHNVDTDAWRAAMAVNCDAVFHCTRALIDSMVAKGQGRIVTIASAAGLEGFAYTAPYCAAKHAAVGLMRALAVEYASKGITANAVCPGFVDTGIVANAACAIAAKTGRSEADARASLAAMNRSGRLIEPDEVAAQVIELIQSGRTGEAVEIV